MGRIKFRQLLLAATCVTFVLELVWPAHAYEASTHEVLSKIAAGILRTPTNFRLR